MKKRRRSIISIGLVMVATLIGSVFYVGSFSSAAPSTSSSASILNQIDMTAYVVSNDTNKNITNGEYEVRFALYANDRDNIDPYPSNADAGKKLWEENQKVNIKDGRLSVYLGSVNPFPASVNFSLGDYYLGIRIGKDDEMVPRKKIAAVPTAINSNFLQGRALGTEAGNIPFLDSSGQLDPSVIPTITALGTITEGVWESDVIGAGYGGTGLSAYAVGDLLYASSSSALAKLAAGTSGQFLTITSGLPAWTTLDLSYSQNISNTGDALIIADSDASGVGDIFLQTGATNKMVILNNGNVGIGTDAPARLLDVDGDVNVAGTVYASSLIISGEATIGTLGLNLYTNTSFIPSASGLNLGSASNHWANLYADNVSVGTLDVDSMNVSGTSSQYFTINTETEVEDTMGLRFYRGSVLNGYAALTWDGAEQNFSLFKKESASTLADLNINVLSASGAGDNYFAGNVGIGTASPSSALHIVNSASGVVTPLIVQSPGNGDTTSIEIKNAATTRLKITADGNAAYAGLLAGVGGIRLAPNGLVVADSQKYFLFALENNIPAISGGYNYSTGAGNSISVRGGDTSNPYNAGDVLIRGGNTTGAGVDGSIKFQSPDNASSFMTILPTGSVGIGTAFGGGTDSANLAVVGTALFETVANAPNGGLSYMTISHDTNGTIINTPSAGKDLRIKTKSIGGIEKTNLTFSANDTFGALSSFTGNVGISDTTPDTTLKVVGSICAKADATDCFGATAGNIYAANFIVDGTTHLPDYVFANDYPLMSLNDLKNYINLNQHLPGVPSASDVSNNGLNLSTMVPAILEKTEENTLYILQNNDQLNTGQQQIAELTLRTDQSITNVAQLKTSVDQQLGVVGASINTINAEIADQTQNGAVQTQLIASLQSRIKTQEDLTVILQKQIDDLKTQISTLDPLQQSAQLDLTTTDISFLKTLLGVDRVTDPADVDLLGKLSATGIETGTLTIKIIDPEAATIGQAVILAGEDSIVIDTTAVKKDSNVFVTIKSKLSADATLMVTDIKEGGSFAVNLVVPAQEDVKFSWWIVDAK
ncbi:MAG: hypothetical protein WC238_05360 [Parcubacteria group bacterium]|jgi:hypothetical protein